MKLDHLSDDALLAELTACCVAGRKNDVRVVAFLIAIEERGIHLLRACSSMFDFCQRKLGMSGGQAWRRIASARLAKKYPFILPLLESGLTHLSTLAQIKVFVTDENVHALVADTAGKTRDQVDRILADRFGLPERPKQTRGVLPIDDELEALMERARELTSHAVPDGDRLVLAKRAFRTYIAELEKKQRAKAKRPRPAPAQPTKSIPRASSFNGTIGECARMAERMTPRIFVPSAELTIVCSHGLPLGTATSRGASTFASRSRRTRMTLKTVEAGDWRAPATRAPTSSRLQAQSDNRPPPKSTSRCRPRQSERIGAQTRAAD